ncbi:MAG: tRNA (adenosine(37)-N6)-threonylcarbamoyltransferase complex dimerization subunit type 1 TsaB [Peptostreptococcaceae bacterium]|nr:tRNA (adenosine(37)-N6)-threonylcarbamoyltransferase complex dimerization subunit type 1 TsaB [Peptostreptococcaceae bacterium]
MNILAFETSGRAASVAVMKDKRIIGEMTVSTKLNHSEKLMPMIDELLEKTEISIKDIDALAVGVGPGSFTGIRIGVSTAKGLALALDIPIAAVSSLRALAYNGIYSDMLVCPIIDARRNQVYSGVFRWEAAELVEVLNEDVYNFKELLFVLKNRNCPILFLGEDAYKFKEQMKEVLGENGILAMPQANFPRAAAVAGMAIKKIDEKDLENAFTLMPVYLRKAEAERQYEERMKKK